jgi:hypothetical protein
MDIVGAELERLGLEAARLVAGEDAVEQVEVVSGEDSSDRPVYYFSFLIDEQRTQQRPGLVRIRLLQRLLDELSARGDEHRPMVKMLNRTDWEHRQRA